MPAIYSTASADQIFPRWDNHPRTGKYDEAVTIKGGTGVQHRKNFQTPRGVATSVTAEQLEFLKSNPVFMEGVKNGYFFIDEKAKRASQEQAEEVAASDMESRDKGAQDTEETYQRSGKKAPKKAKD